MSRLWRGLLVALLHVAIVASLGGKLLWDRQRLPRVWAKTMAYDPELPIRGRYVALTVVVEGRGIPTENQWGPATRLRVENGQLVAEVSEEGGQWITFVDREGARTAVLREPVLFFISEHVPDPTRRPTGEQLWVEVTVPKKGLPRPIRLGVQRAGGEIEPLALD